ncbi:hypothetical protein K474DRAFT_203942 [Panus rudis PR-1116 ss-1]|nr:hypothetical protein K474DRAFT_203942 [Panus rudis PR-1116 ss-1]
MIGYPPFILKMGRPNRKNHTLRVHTIMMNTARSSGGGKPCEPEERHIMAAERCFTHVDCKDWERQLILPRTTASALCLVKWEDKTANRGSLALQYVTGAKTYAQCESVFRSTIVTLGSTHTYSAI